MSPKERREARQFERLYRKANMGRKPRHLTFQQHLVRKGYRMGYDTRFATFMFDRRACRDGPSLFAAFPRKVYR